MNDDSRKTVLGNMYRRPWEDLRELSPDVGMETFGYGGWYFICWATKPACSEAEDDV